MQNQFYQTPLQKRSSADKLRAAARETLKGRWGLAIGVFLLACLLGMHTGEFSLPDNEITQKIEENPEVFWNALLNLDTYLEKFGVVETIRYTVVTYIGVDTLLALGITTLCSKLFILFVGSPITVGYHRFLLDYGDRKPDVCVKTLFTHFSAHYWGAVDLMLLIDLIYAGVGLLTLALLFAVLSMASVLGGAISLILGGLIVILGVVASVYLEYNFALSHFIEADYPPLSAIDVLRNSCALMRGNKWRLFCLRISFVGWIVLTILTMGIGEIVLAPYMNAAMTAFYSELSGRDTAKEVEFPSLDPEDYFTQI